MATLGDARAPDAVGGEASAVLVVPEWSSGNHLVDWSPKTLSSHEKMERYIR